MSDAASRIARVVALQPHMSPQSLAEPVMGTNDPAVLTTLTNLLRVWASGNTKVPVDFTERATVTAVSRQPVVFASVDIERCERQASETLLPLPDGTAIDASEWPTRDLFALVPATPATFATSTQTRRVPLPGRQEAQECGRCGGAGATRCRNCASGQIPCPACGGALRVACSRCGGAGTHLGVSGRMIQCRQCNTRGTVQCDRCARRGTISCPACGGGGEISCAPCAGHGRVVRGWEMVETRRTDARRVTQAAATWSDFDQAFDQSDVVAERVFTVDQDPPQVILDTLAPAGPQQQAATLLNEALAAHAAERRAGAVIDRIAAIRVRLRGVYAYDVTVNYDGVPYRVVVAAGGTMIVPKRLPKAKRGPIAAMLRLIRRYLRALQSDEVPGPQREFVHAVRAGRAHLSDERCVVPDAAAALGVQAEVTEAGYRCHVRTSGELTVAVGMDVRFELNDHDAPHLCIDIDLGEAHRDRLLQMLAANHDLAIGRLAVINGGDGTERLHLVDRRPYGTTDAVQYANVLRLLGATARKLRGREDLI